MKNVLILLEKEQDIVFEGKYLDTATIPIIKITSTK